MKRALLLLNWNQASETAERLAELTAWPGANWEIWVADNGSTDESRALPERFPGVRFVWNGGNRGYAGGLNPALRLLRAEGVEAALLLNSDVNLSLEAAEALFATLSVHPQLGAVGPVLEEPGGRRSYGGRDPGRYVRTRRSHPPRPAVDGLLDADYVPGTVFLFRTALLDEVGYLEEAFFFSGEIADWCARIRAAGWRCAIDPRVSVRHLEDDRNRRRATVYRYYTLRNRFLYVQRHPVFGRRALWTVAGAFQWVRSAFQPDVRRAVAWALGDGIRGQFGNGNKRFHA